MATLSTARKNQGTLKRLPRTDFSAAREFLKMAEALAVPDDQTQRQAFEKLMPHLYVLRNKGCSFKQLTDLLTECGFELQPSTVREYFREGLAKRMDICQERMNEQIVLLKEVRKQTEGSELADITERVAAAIKQQKIHAASKIDAFFGARENTAHTENKNEGLRPAPLKTTIPQASVAPAPVVSEPSVVIEPEFDSGSESDAGSDSAFDSEAGFGLLSSDSVAPAKKTSAASPRSSKPKIQVNAESPEPPKLRCLPLVDGLVSIKQVAGVPDFVRAPGDLEHPAIPGLMLSMGQRLSPTHLEYTDDADGEIIVEDDKQKRFRVMWKVPVPMTISKTDDNFTDIDFSLFPDKNVN